IADKLLLSSSFVILAMKKEIAWWLTIIVLSRDIMILVVAVVIILIWGYRPFPPSILGKLTTLFQIILVFAALFGAAYPQIHFKLLMHILIDIVAMFVGLVEPPKCVAQMVGRIYLEREPLGTRSVELSNTGLLHRAAQQFRR